MLIHGYGLESDKSNRLPAVPPVVVYMDGNILEIIDKHGNKNTSFGFKITNLTEPIEIPNDHWIGVEEDKTYVILSKDEEPKWRISRAIKSIETSQKMHAQTIDSVLQKVNSIHAASALIGIEVQELFNMIIKAKKSPDESVEETIKTISNY